MILQKRWEGSVSVFYAGIFLCLFLLLGILWESVRWENAKTKMTDSSYLALQDVMTEYQRELWDDYHLLFFRRNKWEGEEGVKERLNENLNFSWNQDAGFVRRDYLGGRCLAVRAWTYGEMTDPVVIEKQILAFSKYRAAGEVAEFLLEKAGVLTGIGKGTEIIREKMNLEEKFSDLEKQKNIVFEGLKKLSEYKAAVPENAAQADELEQVDEVYRTALGLREQTEDILKECQIYHERYQGAVQKMKEYQAWLNERKEEFPQEAFQELEKDREELQRYQTEEKNDISGMERKLKRNERILNQVITHCCAEEVSLEEIRGLMEQYDGELSPGEYILAGNGSGENPLSQIKNYAVSNLLALILPKGTEVSKQSLPKEDWQNMEYEKTDSGIEARIALLQYIGMHFGNFRDVNPSAALQYEQEYLLIGKEQESDNLSGTMAELLALRTSVRFLEKITDTEEVAKARKLAMSIAGVTGTSALIPVIKTSFLVLWSIEDAIKDVQGLYRGEKIPVYDNFSHFSLDYEGYLMLLLLLGEKEKQELRIVRLVEGTVQERYETEFHAKDYAAGIGMETELQMRLHFIPKKGEECFVYRETYQSCY